MGGWTEEKIDYSIKDKGLVHYYNPDKDYYPAVAYPFELGELKHIYQNDIGMFDLIDMFEKTVVEKGGKKLYLYKFNEEVASGSIQKLEFLWK